MSFGFGVGDLLGTAQLAYTLWKYCYKVARDAPQDFKLLVSEISTLSQSLRLLEEETRDPNSTLMKSGEDRVRMLNELVLRVTGTLRDLQKIAEKYEKLGTMSRSGVRQTWAKFKWSVDASDLDALRNKLVYHNGIISLLLISCGNSSLQRIEATVTKLERRFSEIGEIMHKFGTEGAPGVSAVNAPSSKITLLQLNAALMENAEMGQRKWSSIGVDEWIQAGRWWLMKGQTELIETKMGDRTLAVQGYLNLIKASWILVDVIARHPQLNLLDTSVRYEIEILSEIIRNELGDIGASENPKPNFSQLLQSDLRVWESQSKGPALQVTNAPENPLLTGSQIWMTADEHVIFRRFGEYRSRGDSIPIPCIVLVLLHKVENKARIVVSNQTWVTLEEYSARTIKLNAVDRTVNVKHQVLRLLTALDARLLCVIWDALGEYQLNRDTAHSEPQVLTSFIILVAVKHSDHEVVERVMREENGAGSRPCPQTSFAVRLRVEAERLALKLISQRGKRTPTSMSLFDWAARNNYHSVAAALLHRIGIVTSEPDTIRWWYAWENLVKSKTITVLMLFLFEGRTDVNLWRGESGYGFLYTAAKGGWVDGVALLLQAGAHVNASEAVLVAVEEGHEAVVDKLLQAGPGISRLGRALEAAAGRGHESMVEKLLKYDTRIMWYSDQMCGSNALKAAARGGHETVITMLLKAGRILFHDWALVAAAREGHTGVVKILLNECSGIEVNDSLLHATRRGHDAIVRLLVQAGANRPNVVELYQAALKEAALYGHTAVVRRVLNACAARGRGVSDPFTLFTAAARNVDVVDLLFEQGVINANTIHVDGRTLLHTAAIFGSPEVVDAVLKAGADVNCQGCKGATALSKAAARGSEEIVQMLLKAGANVHSRDTIGRTALHEAAQYGHTVVGHILLNAGANLDVACKDNQTALFVAASNDCHSMVAMLISAGAKINTQSSSGRTPLHIAVHWDHESVSDLLLEAGADTNTQCNHLETPLYTAAARGAQAMVDRLITAGADVKTRCSGQETALKVAIKNRHHAVVNCLCMAGAIE